MKVMYLSRDEGTEYRGVKTCNSLAAMGHEVVLAGWDRSPEAATGSNPAAEAKLRQLLRAEIRTRILRRPGVFAKNSLQGWGAYYRHVVRCLWEERPDVVQVVNEEKAAMIFPFKRILFRHLVEDVHDSVIANRYRNAFLGLSARLCRWIGNLAADCIIETGPELQEMLGPFARKSIIIENAPFDPGAELSARVPTSGPVRLHLGGYLSRERMALETLIKAIDLLPAGSVRIEASGWLVDDFAKDTFSKHPAVNYRWLAKPIDFLTGAANCDALLYLRGDAHESAYRAAVRPNRIFDALAVGRPIIVNSELAIAKWVERDNLGFVLKQLDAAELAAVIKSLPGRRAGLAQEAARFRKIFLDGHVWPVMERRLAELYRRYDKAASKAQAPALYGALKPSAHD